MIPVILALTFSILLTSAIAIPGIILCLRWFAISADSDSDIGVGDMKIPTFYATESKSEAFRDLVARVICMSFVGGVFGGIHCVGWFFDFPSSVEAMLWRVSSAVLTGIAFLFLIFLTFVTIFFSLSNAWTIPDQRQYFAFSAASAFTPFLLVYVVSRLLLLVEAFISLRDLTPGMLALVKWTSFIPHI